MARHEFQKTFIFAVDKPISRSLYSGHRRGRPLRRDDAPLKLLTGTVKKASDSLRVLGFDGSPPVWREGIARSPGCLTSESEERETWTAGSLRAAVSWRRNSTRARGQEETSDGLRLKGTSLVARPVGGPRQNVKTLRKRRDQSGLNFSSNLRV